MDKSWKSAKEYGIETQTALAKEVDVRKIAKKLDPEHFVEALRTIININNYNMRTMELALEKNDGSAYLLALNNVLTVKDVMLLVAPDLKDLYHNMRQHHDFLTTNKEVKADELQ